MSDELGKVGNGALVELTSQIVSAYVGNNAAASGDLGNLIGNVHAALVKAAGAAKVEEQKELVPAVPVKKSVTNDYIVCLEDGKKFRSIKRHLRTAYNMSMEEYRAKWGLSADYPAVAPAYAAQRSELAKQMGLGRRGAPVAYSAAAE